MRERQRLGAAAAAEGEQFDRAPAIGPGAAPAAYGMVSCACLQQIDAMPQDRITISGPKSDGTYIVEFKTAAGEALAISVPSGETAVLKHFQERMPYGLVVPDAAEPPDDG